jgi:hypothetical protein
VKLEHDLICRPGRWSIRGELRCDERTLLLQGEVTVVRKRTEWHGTALIATEPHATAPSPIVCVIQRCPQGSHWASWRSDSGPRNLGAVIGRFVQNGATCLSLWESADGAYTGSDWLGPVHAGSCVTYGAVLRGGIPQWCWELELSRAS